MDNKESDQEPSGYTRYRPHDSEDLAKYMENFKYGPEKREEVLEKYRRLLETDFTSIESVQEPSGYTYYHSQDSEVVAEYMEQHHYDPEKVEEVLEKYRRLLESDDDPALVKKKK